MRRFLAGGTAVLVGLALPAGSAAAPKPKVKVTSLSGAPERVTAGRTFGVKVTVAAARGAPVTVSLNFSRDRRLGSADIRLGKPRTARPKGRRPVAMRGKAPADPAGDGYLLACATVKGSPPVCRASRRGFAIDGGTAAEKIDAAARGRGISAVDALRFKAFAVMGDPRLPARFRADRGTTEDGTPVMREVGVKLPTLPEKAQEELLPLFVPPIYARPDGKPTAFGAGRGVRGAGFDSCTVGGFPFAGRILNGFNPGDYQKAAPPVVAADGKVKIWFGRAAEAEHRAYAERMATVINDVWPRYAELLGRTPLDDTNVMCHLNGGDGALDIYLNPRLAAQALTLGYPPKGDGTPAFILWNPADQDVARNLQFAVAHELFHPFQMAFDYWGPTAAYLNVDEGTAHWAGNFVAPQSDYEHRRDDWFTRAGDFHGFTPRGGYDLWPFFLYLTRRNDASLIRRTYENFEKTGPVRAVEQATPGGLGPVWDDFAVDGLNLPPDAYFAFDRFGAQPGREYAEGLEESKGKVKLGRSKALTFHHETSLTMLDRHYTGYDFSDSKIKQIGYHNNVEEPADDDGIAKPGANYRVRAFLTFAGGQTRMEDWTDRTSASFCRSRSGENLRKLLIVESNSHSDETSDGSSNDGKNWINDPRGTTIDVSSKACKRPPATTPPPPPAQFSIGYRATYDSEYREERSYDCRSDIGHHWYGHGTVTKTEHSTVSPVSWEGGHLRGTSTYHSYSEDHYVYPDGRRSDTVNAPPDQVSETHGPPPIERWPSITGGELVARDDAGNEYRYPGKFGDAFTVQANYTRRPEIEPPPCETKTITGKYTLKLEPVREEGCAPPSEPLLVRSCFTAREQG